MIQKKFPQNTHISERQRIGQLAGIIGIAVNACLFFLKLTLGLLSNSVSVIADGFNNLGDCISSLVTTVGFYLSGKDADTKHPYGYGRMEYISGFIVALLIIITALSVGKFSIMRMLSPEPSMLTTKLLFAQIFAIIVKLIFAFYIHVINSKFDSAVLNATLKDSLADAGVTTAALLSLLTSQFTSLPVDGIAGFIIAIMILGAGITSFKEHLDLLLGNSVNKKTIEEISTVIKKYYVLGDMKALYIYDFGPEKQVAFLKIVPKVSPHFKETQNAIQNFTSQLKNDYNIDATVYWDTTHVENHSTKKKQSFTYINYSQNN